MSYKRILTVQDISCVGQCSLTVALPILSACGHETGILPSAVLSTHTAGFKGFTCRDLTEDMPDIMAHWRKEGISFDAIYTGYLGSVKQIDYVKEMFETLLKEGGLSIVDPAMADNGKLYPAFDGEYVEGMKKLAASADIILPNITEACYLCGVEYRETYDVEYIDEILRRLREGGARTIVLTGVSYTEDTTGVVVLEKDEKSYYRHRRILKGSHGTGDVYASAFTGALLEGMGVYESASVAAEYTVRCIENTMDDESHWYGVKFEPVLPWLIGQLKKEKKED